MALRLSRRCCAVPAQGSPNLLIRTTISDKSALTGPSDRRLPISRKPHLVGAPCRRGRCHHVEPKAKQVHGPRLFNRCVE